MGSGLGTRGSSRLAVYFGETKARIKMKNLTAIIICTFRYQADSHLKCWIRDPAVNKAVRQASRRIESPIYDQVDVETRLRILDQIWERIDK